MRDSASWGQCGFAFGCAMSAGGLGEAGAHGGSVFGGKREAALDEGLQIVGTAGAAHQSGWGVGGGSKKEVTEFMGEDEGESLIEGGGERPSPGERFDAGEVDGGMVAETGAHEGEAESVGRERAGGFVNNADVKRLGRFQARVTCGQAASFGGAVDPKEEDSCAAEDPRGFPSRAGEDSGAGA